METSQWSLSMLNGFKFKLCMRKSMRVQRMQCITIHNGSNYTPLVSNCMSKLLETACWAEQFIKTLGSGSTVSKLQFLSGVEAYVMTFETTLTYSVIATMVRGYLMYALDLKAFTPKKSYLTHSALLTAAETGRTGTTWKMSVPDRC